MRSEAEQRKTERSDASNTRGSRIMGTLWYIATSAPNVATSISCSGSMCNLSSPVPPIPARTREPRPLTHRRKPRSDRALQCHYQHRSPSAPHRRVERLRSEPKQGKRRPNLGRSRGPAASGRATRKAKKGPTTPGFPAKDFLVWTPVREGSSWELQIPARTSLSSVRTI